MNAFKNPLVVVAVIAGAWYLLGGGHSSISSSSLGGSDWANRSEAARWPWHD